MLGETILEVCIECWQSLTAPEHRPYFLFAIGLVVAFIWYSTCNGWSNEMALIWSLRKVLRKVTGCVFSEGIAILIALCLWAAFCFGGIWALPVCGVVLVSGWLTRIVDREEPPMKKVSDGRDHIPLK